MAAPTRYELTYDFTAFQEANPNTPLPADKIEIEFNNLQLTTDELIDNLGLIQRSDGKLNNGVVSIEALSNSVKALLGSPVNPRGAWVTATAYAKLDLVEFSNSVYIAVLDHTSSASFTTDLSNSKWMLWADGKSTITNWLPSVYDGSVDLTSEFEDFLRQNDGKTVHIPDGIYLINDLFGSVTLLADLPDVRVICEKNVVIKYDKGSSVVDYPGQLAAGDQFLISALTLARVNSTDYVTRLTVSALPTGIEKGKYVHIHCEEKWLVDLVGWAGESAKISSWVSAGGGSYYLYLDRALAYGTFLGASSTLKAHLYGNKVFEWEGGLTTANGNYDDPTAYTAINPSAFTVHGVVGYKFINQTFEKTWGSCRTVEACCGGLTEGTVLRKLPNMLNPVAPTVAITGISKANPGVITAPGHGVASGSITAWLTGIGGMTELNGKWYTLTYASANTFTIKDYDTQSNLDTSGFTTYTSGGTLQTGEVFALGYGDVHRGACTDNVVRDVRSSEGRHAVFTTSATRGTSSYTTANWYIYGMPTHILIEDCVAQGSYGTPFDTHEAGKFITFKNCHAQNVWAGPERGTTRGQGFNLRSMDTLLDSCSVNGGLVGVAIDDINHPEKPVYIIRNFNAENIYDASGTLGYGMWLHGSNITNPAEVNVDGYTAKNVNVMFYMENRTIARVKNTHAIRVDMYAKQFGGALFESYDAPTIDFIDNPLNPTPNYMFNMSSDLTYGGPTALLMDGINVVRNTSSQQVFYESDKVATKTIYCSQINERFTGTTETRMTSPGATTFVWAADVNSKIVTKPQKPFATNGVIKTITGATQANPCVITCTSHGFTSGSRPYIKDIVGMTQLNGGTYSVTIIDANSFSLLDLDGIAIDSTGFTAYVSGGTAQQAIVLDGYDAGRVASVSVVNTPVVCLRKMLPPGTILEVNQRGTGQITFVVEQGGTITSLSGNNKTIGQYSKVFAEVFSNSDMKSAIWQLSGDLAGASNPNEEFILLTVGDETTAVTTGTGKLTFRMPFAMTLTQIPRASVTTAPTGTTLIIDINEAGASILSTKLSIDVSEKTSTTAATAAVLSDTSLAEDAEITIDIDQIGSGTAGAGVKVMLIGRRT